MYHCNFNPFKEISKLWLSFRHLWSLQKKICELVGISFKQLGESVIFDCWLLIRMNLKLVFVATASYSRWSHICSQDEWVSECDNSILILTQFWPDVSWWYFLFVSYYLCSAILAQLANYTDPKIEYFQFFPWHYEKQWCTWSHNLNQNFPCRHFSIDVICPSWKLWGKCFLYKERILLFELVTYAEKSC